MEHIKPEQLQLYLAGELDLAAAELVDGHLRHCSECEALLVAIAADDAGLAGALALTPEEAEWVAAQDLRPVVMVKLVPWFRQPQGLLLLVTLLAAAGWMLQQTVGLLTRTLSFSGPVGVTVDLLEGSARLAWTFLTYMGSGGPVAALTPFVLVLTAVVVIRRRKTSDA